MDEKTSRRLEQLLDYRFSNPSLLAEALAHSSQAETPLSSNERLEFLGDSVLALIICQTLFTQFTDYLEGDLTKIKSMLVSRRTCARLASDMGLDSCINVGKGISSSRSLSGSIAAGALESVIAAIYTDSGLEQAKTFILNIFSPLIEAADAQQHQENFKSLLQQHAQQNFNATPMYELLDEKGPDHDKCFECAVLLKGKRYRSAWGNNKKEAEQLAAYNALSELGILND